MLSKKHNPDMSRVPLWKKMNLTVEEAPNTQEQAYLKLKKFQIKKTVPLSYGMEQSGC